MTPYLSLSIWVPIVAGVAVLGLSRDSDAMKARWTALVGALAAFLVTIPLYTHFDTTTSAMQFVERREWIPYFDIFYHLGVDGISVLFVILNAFTTLLVVWAGWEAIKVRVAQYMAAFLIMSGLINGAFAALDGILFYVFFEAMLIPMYLIIGIWGGERRVYAAIKFFLYTLVGSVVMLLAIIKLYFITSDAAVVQNLAMVQAAGKTMSGANAAMQSLLESAYSSIRAGHGTFSIPALQAVGGAHFVSGLPLIAASLQVLLFAGLFVGFAIKVPMFPFHTWLPDAHVEAPTAGSVILAGVLLKLGGYGFIRLSLPVLPDACRDPQVLAVVIALAIAGIVYGALCSMYFVVTSGDMKKLVAYSSVSHMGMVILGVFALNPNGINGAVLQMINHGISTSALFLIVGILYERRHTRLVSEYGGLSSVTPGFATVFMIMVMSSIGLPLLNGFIGEFLVLRGAFEANPWWAGWGVLGIVLGAAYTLWLYQRLMFGPVDNEANKLLPDLDRREWAYMLPLVVLAFWIGLYPKPVLDLVGRPVQLIAYQVWHTPGTEDRYAPTPEQQEKLVRERSSRVVDQAVPAIEVPPAAAVPEKQP